MNPAESQENEFKGNRPHEKLMDHWLLLISTFECKTASCHGNKKLTITVVVKCDLKKCPGPIKCKWTSANIPFSKNKGTWIYDNLTNHQRHFSNLQDKLTLSPLHFNTVDILLDVILLRLIKKVKTASVNSCRSVFEQAIYEFKIDNEVGKLVKIQLMDEVCLAALFQQPWLSKKLHIISGPIFKVKK